MYRRTDVVTVTGKGELRRARAAPDAILGLDHEDRMSSLRESYRGSEPVRSCADDDRIVGSELGHFVTAWRGDGRRRSASSPRRIPIERGRARRGATRSTGTRCRAWLARA